MSSERNFIGFPSDFTDSAYKTRTENLSRNCRRFFREVPASDDDEECAFTCLSRATGGVWHDLSRVANLPEDLDAAFFPWHFLLVPSQSPFPVGSVSPLRSSLHSSSSRRCTTSSSSRRAVPRRNGHFARQMRLPVTLIRDALRPPVLAQEEVVARCQAVACHVYAAPPWKIKGIRAGC